MSWSGRRIRSGELDRLVVSIVAESLVNFLTMWKRPETLVFGSRNFPNISQADALRWRRWEL